MNAKQITSGGLASTKTFWQVSIPLVIASIIVPVAFSGLLIHVAMILIRPIYRMWLKHRRLIIVGIFLAVNVASAVVGGRPLFWTVWTMNLLYTVDFLRLAKIWLELPRELLQVSGRIRAAEAATSVGYQSVIRVEDVRKRRDIAFKLCFGALVILGGFGLGFTFLVLDIFRHKTSGLSIYHSFGLWMSLAAGIPWLGRRIYSSYSFRGESLLYSMYTTFDKYS